MPPSVVTFGEIMLRLSPPGNQRFAQAREFDVVYGGGESNVAVSLANFGFDAQFVTRLPSNDIARSAVNYLRQFGVGTEHIITGGERIGIYFLEKGAAQRGSKVIYDRSGSSLAQIEPGMIDWKSVFSQVDWFHWTGITPAISQGAAETCREALIAAKKAHLTVSCDLNYRSKLWKWGKTPDEVMRELVEMTDIAIGNEEDAEKVFGIAAPNVDITRDTIDPDAYLKVCQKMKEQFPKLQTICFTLRSSMSATHNRWSGVMWREGVLFFGPSFEIPFIVDRVGAGDSFSAGIIYALHTYNDDLQKMIDFAVTSSALKHSIPGDFNLVSIEEVERVMAGDHSGRVSR